MSFLARHRVQCDAVGTSGKSYGDYACQLMHNALRNTTSIERAINTRSRQDAHTKNASVTLLDKAVA